MSADINAVRSVNPDLQTERNKGSFNITELTNILDGGKDRTARRKEIATILFKDPLFRTHDLIYLSHTEQYAVAIERSVKLYSLRKKLKWSDEDFIIATSLIRQLDVFYLHNDVFIPALEGLATEEQKQKWLIPAKKFQILGAYAQTELGHGSNLRGLETTATYDRATQEFVLNTPSLSSIKWWPGAMALTSNYCVLMAQLVIDGKKYGMQPFMLQLRSLEDHTKRPGIELGYIGPKMGQHFNDNGFLFLRNVRIPRTNMLMRNSQVTPDGRFVTQGPSKANYSTMMLVRVGICRRSYIGLSYSCTAAIRYSAVRRQSSLKPGAPEMQVIDYQTQQYKLLPPLASAYGFFFASNGLRSTYNDVLQEVEQGNIGRLQELHIISSGLKALTTDIATEEMEICRRSCGGHGYLMSAGLSEYLYSAATGLVTVEGENTVLYLQVGRYLLKQMMQHISGETLHGTTRYLQENDDSYQCPIKQELDCKNLSYIIRLYEKAARGITCKVAQQFKTDLDTSESRDIAMNKNLQPLVHAAMLHSFLLVVAYYVKGVVSVMASPPLKKILTSLCCLFGIHHLIKMSGDFLQTNALGTEQLHWFRDVELQLLAELRPEAVCLVDAFDLHDETLCSAIGSYDGQAYRRLYEAAQKDPLNKHQVDPSYKHLRQLMQDKNISKL